VWIDCAEAAQRLRMRPRTLRAHAAAGRVPACKPSGGGEWLFDPDELDGWVKAGRNRAPIAAYIAPVATPIPAMRRDTSAPPLRFGKFD